MRRALACAVLLFLAACSSVPQPPPPPAPAPAPGPALDALPSVEPGESFRLHIGEGAFIPSENLKVYVRNITEDSRCPSDVTCVWAGQARVELVILKDSEVIAKHAALVDGEDLILQDYLLRVEALEPYPVSTRRIEPSDYIATVVVRKA